MTPWRQTLNVEWTDERPTEPGEYWLSLHPSQRQDAMETDEAVSECRLAQNRRRLSGRDRDGAWAMSIHEPVLDGAKWSRRETPADPFEEAKAAQRAAEDDVMKPKLKVVIKTKTSSCEVDLVTNRANTAFLWVVAGGLGDADTSERLKALKESVARWVATVPKDVAEDLFGGDAK